MYQELMKIIQNASQDVIASNPEIPAGQEDAVMAEAGNSVVSTLQNMMANGQANQVLNFFGSKGNNLQGNPVTNAISGTFINNISRRLGINPQIAGAIAAVAIPLILKRFLSKTNNPQDNSLDIQDIFNTISGNKTSGINLPDILSKFSGGSAAQSNVQANPMDRDGDGDVDLNDLIGAFAGGQQQQPQQQQSPLGGGGLFDLLRGMVSR